MKSATIPSLRVEPELRAAAESVLRENESLSSFVVQSLQANIHRRRLRQQFIARGLASRQQAKQSGEYFAVDEVLEAVDAILGQADKP